MSELALIWRPYFSVPLIWAIALTLLALCTVACVRSYHAGRAVSVFSFVCRSILILCLALLMMGPSRTPTDEDREPTRDTVVMMLDTSASMQHNDMTGQPRVTFAAQKWFSPEYLAQMRAKHNVRLMTFDEKSRLAGQDAYDAPAEQLAQARATHLAQSLEQVISDLSARGEDADIVVVSDGRDSSDASLAAAAELADKAHVAVHAVALGTSDIMMDVSLSVQLAQSHLYVNEKGRINVTLNQTGLDNEVVRVYLRGDGTELSQDVTFDGRQHVEVSWPIEHDEAGLYEYEARVETATPEIETGNNRQMVFVPVSPRRLRVLVIEGQPYWETKFLAHALRRDDRISLTQVSQLNSMRRETIVSREDADQTQVPRTAEEMAAYDVIVLGRGIERVVETSDFAAQLRTYVSEHGGALLLARGRPCEPAEDLVLASELSALEPVVWDEGRVTEQAMTLSHAGKANPAFGDFWMQVMQWSQQTSVSGQRVASVKPAAVVLAELQPQMKRVEQARMSRPAIVSMTYGRGRVLVVLAEGLWRWRLLAVERKQTQQFDLLWQNMVRWMAMAGEFAPGQKLSMSLSARNLRMGEQLDLVLASRSSEVVPTTLEVVSPSGNVQSLALQSQSGDSDRWLAQFVANEMGTHQLQLKSSDGLTQVSRFNSYDINVERLHNGARPGVLRDLAEKTGGAFLNPEDPGALLDLLHARQASRIVPAEMVYIWDQGWIMVLLLLWMGAEWIVRKLGGLL